MNSYWRRCISLLSILFALTVAASAQDVQRFETFGGYSLTHDTSYIATSTNGWDTNTTVFLKRWLGFTTDFSGNYGSTTFPIIILGGYGPVGKVAETVSSYTYMAGPHFTYRRSRCAPFAQTLFGVYHPRANYIILDAGESVGLIGPPAGTTGSYSYTKFAMAVGGGLDFNVARGISVRPFQAEYLLLRQPGTALSNGAIVPITFNDNTFRFSTGITFRFGSHLGPSR